MLTKADIEQYGLRVAFAILNFNGDGAMRNAIFSRHPLLYGKKK